MRSVLPASENLHNSGPMQCSKSTSLDDLVGEQLDRVGHLDAEQPGRLQVDDEL